MTSQYRRFCRIVALVFVLVTAYTLMTKVPQGRLAHDWAHSVLHLLSAVLAAYAGWSRSSPRLAVLVTSGVALAYLPLGIGGWAVEGLFLGTPVAIPLGAADNVFHLMLGAGALFAIFLGHRQSQSSNRTG